MSSDVEKTPPEDVIKIDPTKLVRYLPDDAGNENDNGTMPRNVETLSRAVIGRKIVSAELGRIPGTGFYWFRPSNCLILTLDDGTRVALRDTDDCCAFTELDNFLLHPENVQHVITGVGTEDGYTKWHIYADFGDILDMDVSLSAGNPFYYGYGFAIDVIPMPDQLAIDITTV